jgi:hypothetical protein
MSNQEKSSKRGRPTVSNSARQARLAAREARVAAGGSVQRGRPASEGSARQAKLAVKAAKIASGETIKRGRPTSVTPKALKVPKVSKMPAVPKALRPKKVVAEVLDEVEAIQA